MKLNDLPNEAEPLFSDLSRIPASPELIATLEPTRTRVVASITKHARRAPRGHELTSYGEVFDTIMANVVLGQGQPICWPMSHRDPSRYIEGNHRATQTVLKAMEVALLPDEDAMRAYMEHSRALGPRGPYPCPICFARDEGQHRLTPLDDMDEANAILKCYSCGERFVLAVGTTSNRQA